MRSIWRMQRDESTSKLSLNGKAPKDIIHLGFRPGSRLSKPRKMLDRPCPLFSIKLQENHGSPSEGERGRKSRHRVLRFLLPVKQIPVDMGAFDRSERKVGVQRPLKFWVFNPLVSYETP